MRYVMYLVIAAAMLAAYLSSPPVGLAPSVVKFLPDVLSAFTVVYVTIVGTRRRFSYISPKYWLTFGAIALIMVCGALVNDESVGPIVNGMRLYLRAIPFFFVAAVVDFTDRDIQRYLGFILGLSLLQTPLAIMQRHTIELHSNFSGDAVFGTLMISGILTIFLISVLCIMASLMLRGRLSKTWFAIFFALLVIPMSINETKVTVVLLPLGLLVTFALASPPGRRIPVTLAALGLLIAAGAIFVPLYDYYNTHNNPVPVTIEDFFTKDSAGTYSTYNEKNARLGTDDEAGRSDGLMAPFKYLGHDPIKFAFGLGLGNASLSSLGPQFSGKYQPVYRVFVRTLSVTAFSFELGFMGTALILLLHWMVLRDALAVAKRDPGLLGSLAPGYVGAWITITIGLFYLTIHTFESLSFTFWFFSGLMAARREQLAASPSRSEARSRPAMGATALRLKTR